MSGQDGARTPAEGAVSPEAGEPGPHTRSLTVGLGASGGVSCDEVLGLIRRVLHDAGLPVGALAELATVDAKAGEPGLLCAADRLEVPLRTYPARVLSEVEVPTPSVVARAAVATPSVAEAAALTASGEGGRLLVRKTTSVPSQGRTAAMATAAVAAKAQIGPDGAPRAGARLQHGTTDRKEQQ